MNSLKSEQMELIRDGSCIFMSFWLLDGSQFAPISYQCIEVRVMLRAYFWLFGLVSFAPYVFVYIDGQICVIFEFSNKCIIFEFSDICIIFEFFDPDFVEYLDSSHPVFVFYQCFKLTWLPNNQIWCHLYISIFSLISLHLVTGFIIVQHPLQIFYGNE